MRTLALEEQVAAVEQRNKKQKGTRAVIRRDEREPLARLGNDWIIEPMSTRYTKM